LDQQIFDSQKLLSHFCGSLFETVIPRAAGSHLIHKLLLCGAGDLLLTFQSEKQISRSAKTNLQILISLAAARGNDSVFE
jgi:hypothetical protein